MSDAKTMTEVDYEQSMRLPEGKTCGDCVHVRRCLAFGFTDDKRNVWCDFFPNKFSLPIAPRRVAAEAVRGKL